MSDDDADPRPPLGFRTDVDKKGWGSLMPDKGWQRRFDEPISVVSLGKTCSPNRDPELPINTK
jgi:hypothetical protein